MGVSGMEVCEEAGMPMFFLHLSDCHVKASGIEESRIAAICRAVRSRVTPNARLMVVVSGDVAFSGRASEYSLATVSFRALAQGLAQVMGNAQPSWVIVPGNHDCNFEQDSGVRRAVLKTIGPTSEWDPSLPEECTRVQGDFFSFVRALPGSLLRFESNRLIDSLEIDHEERKIRFWGINTAWMSQLKESPGSLWFPLHELQSMVEAEDALLNILVMHHPPSWMAAPLKRQMLQFLDSAFDLVIAGHEHEVEAWGRDDLGGQRTLNVEGGVLQEHGGAPEKSSFNLIRIDLPSGVMGVSEFENDTGLYRNHEERVYHCEGGKHSVKPYRRLSRQHESFLRSAGANFRHPRSERSLDLQDVFIEPDLVDLQEAEEGAVVEKIVPSADVLNSLNDESYVAIGGAEKAGKTAWLRWSFLQLHNRGITPVFLEGSQLRTTERGRVTKVVTDAYMSQYESEDAEEWLQLDASFKAVLLDDIDTSPLNEESRAAVLEHLRSMFSVVIFSCDDAYLLQDVRERACYDGIKRLQLPEFGHRLRDQLVGKWIRLGSQSDLSESSYQVLRDQRVRAINTLIGQAFVPSRPIFLLTLLQSMELGAEASIRGSSLGEYYEYLIRHALLGAKVQIRDLDAVQNYLTELGYFIVHGDRASIESGELAEFDANFASRYDINFNFDSLHHKLLVADVLEVWGARYRFKYRYVLLFFAARYLARRFGKDPEATRIVGALGRSLSVSRYADLMLFVVHHSEDPAVVDILLEQANACFSETNEFELSVADAQPINDLVEELPKLALVDESVEKRRDRKLRAQDRKDRRKAVESKDSGEFSLSSLQDDGVNTALDYAQRLSLGIRILGMLGQVLRNYYGSMVADRKEVIARASYKLLGRMVRSNIDLFVSGKEDLVQFLSEEFEKKGITDKVKARSLAGHFLFGFSSYLVFLYLKKASEFLGSDKLLPTHLKVSNAIASPLSGLLLLAIKLEHPPFPTAAGPSRAAVSIAELECHDRGLEGNPCAKVVLRRLVRDYLYMFDVGYKERQKICEKLGIAVRFQRQIRAMSRRKRN